MASSATETILQEKKIVMKSQQNWRKANKNWDILKAGKSKVSLNIGCNLLKCESVGFNIVHEIVLSTTKPPKNQIRLILQQVRLQNDLRNKDYRTNDITKIRICE